MARAPALVNSNNPNGSRRLEPPDTVKSNSYHPLLRRLRFSKLKVSIVRKAPLCIAIEC